MKRRIYPLPTCILLCLMVSCNSSLDRIPDDGKTAEDLVCLYNRELNCVRVRVKEDTPRVTYNGKMYFFCEEPCRVAFEKNPEKYLRSENKKRR